MEIVDELPTAAEQPGVLDPGYTGSDEAAHAPAGSPCTAAPPCARRPTRPTVSVPRWSPGELDVGVGGRRFRRDRAGSGPSLCGGRRRRDARGAAARIASTRCAPAWARPCGSCRWSPTRAGARRSTGRSRPTEPPMAVSTWWWSPRAAGRPGGPPTRRSTTSRRALDATSTCRGRCCGRRSGLSASRRAPRRRPLRGRRFGRGAGTGARVRGVQRGEGGPPVAGALGRARRGRHRGAGHGRRARLRGDVAHRVDRRPGRGDAASGRRRAHGAVPAPPLAAGVGHRARSRPRRRARVGAVTVLADVVTPDTRRRTYLASGAWDGVTLPARAALHASRRPDDRAVIADPRRLEMSTEGILMEGFRQIDELRRIAPDMPAHHALLALARPVLPPLRDLSPEQLDVLQLVINYGTVETDPQQEPRQRPRHQRSADQADQAGFIRTAAAASPGGRPLSPMLHA